MSNLNIMYAAQANSPATTTVGEISSTDTSVTVADASVLPVAPFLLTLGIDKSAAETVLVSAKVGNVLTITRGVDGTALLWIAGTKCARTLTAKDLNDLQENIRTLNTDKLEKVSSPADGNFVAFNGTSGEQKDSGKKISDFNEATNNLAAEAALADGDAFPFYDASSSANRKTLWSSIKSVLKTYFNTLYAAATHSHTKSQITDFPTEMTPSSHTHGNISNDGAIGSTANKAVYTGTSGALQAGTLPLSAGGTGQTTALTAALALGRGYGTCATAAATQAKVATLSGFVLATGAIVGVKFTYANSNASPTLNVNSTGAKYIYSYMTGTYITTDDITAGMVALFQYNGTQWVLLNPAASTGGGGTSYHATLAAASWYKGTVSSDLTYWYCYNLSVSGFMPATHDVMVFPADAASAAWFAENASCEASTSSGVVILNAAALPSIALNVLFLIYERS